MQSYKKKHLTQHNKTIHNTTTTHRLFYNQKHIKNQTSQSQHTQTQTQNKNNHIQAHTPKHKTKHTHEQKHGQSTSTAQ